MTRTFRAALLCSGLLPGGWACARAPYQYQPPAATAVAAGPAGTAAAEAAPQLLFLSFRMRAAPRHLTLVSAVAVPGQALTLGEEEIGAAYLILTQLDANQQPCAAPLKVPHPLLRDLEYPADDGALRRRAVAVPEAEFFVRVVRQPRAVAVRVTEVAAAVPEPLALTLPLIISKP